MILASPDGSGGAVATHDEQGAIAFQPIRARSLQVADHVHSVGAMSASLTRLGPRRLGLCEGAMTYAVLDHVDDPYSFEVEEPSEVVASGGSACPDPLCRPSRSRCGRLADALATWSSLSRFWASCEAARRCRINTSPRRYGGSMMMTMGATSRGADGGCRTSPVDVPDNETL